VVAQRACTHDVPPPPTPVCAVEEDCYALRVQVCGLCVYVDVCICVWMCVCVYLVCAVCGVMHTPKVDICVVHSLLSKL